jgi:hypothetical protein
MTVMMTAIVVTFASAWSTGAALLVLTVTAKKRASMIATILRKRIDFPSFLFASLQG